MHTPPTTKPNLPQLKKRTTCNNLTILKTFNKSYKITNHSKTIHNYIKSTEQKLKKTSVHYFYIQHSTKKITENDKQFMSIQRLSHLTFPLLLVHPILCHP